MKHQAGKSNLVVKPQKPAAGWAVKYTAEDDMTCPLCIEPMDMTDINFRPCPCGYRMCLFCYKKVVDMCNSICPNCRREYGTAMEEGVEACNNNAGFERPPPPPRLVAEQAAAAAGHNNNNHTGAAAHVGNAAARQAAVAIHRPAQQAVRARGVDGGGVGPAAATRRPGDEAPALPRNAMWAKPEAMQQDREERPAAAPQPPPPPAPIIADSSAWPDLAAAVTQPPPPPPAQPRPHRERDRESSPQERQQQQQVLQQPEPVAAQQHNPAPHQQGQHAQQYTGQQQQQVPQQAKAQQAACTAVNTAQAQAMARVDSMACDPVVDPQQLGYHVAGSAFGGQVGPSMTVPVAAAVFPGQQISTKVGLPTGNEPAFTGEAAVAKNMLDEGRADERAMGARLLEMIRKGDAGANGRVAASRPPPGFGAPMVLSPADSPVVSNPPIGRFQPIAPPNALQQPPMQQPQQQQQPVAAGFGGAGSGSVPTYSLWGSPMRGQGEVATSYNNWLGGAAAEGNGLHAGALTQGSFTGFAPMGGAMLAGPQPTPVLNKPPPPGFAQPVQQPQYQVNNNDGYYNPLGGAFNFAAMPTARAPPPGMVYGRPQQPVLN